MDTVTLELKLPQNVYLALQSAGLNHHELGERATRNFALQLYADGRLSLGKAAELAQMPLLNFWLYLVEHHIPVFEYTEDDYLADLATVQRVLANETQSQ